MCLFERYAQHLIDTHTMEQSGMADLRQFSAPKFRRLCVSKCEHEADPGR